MNGLTFARSILLARPGLTTLLDAPILDKIFVGVIPPGATLPCVGLTEVSLTEHTALSGGAYALSFSRVQVTVAGTTLRQCKEVLAQARYACRNFVGTVDGVPNVKCKIEIGGPDFGHEAGFAMQTFDVRVTFPDAP